MGICSHVPGVNTGISAARADHFDLRAGHAGEYIFELALYGHVCTGLMLPAQITRSVIGDQKFIVLPFSVFCHEKLLH